MKRISIITILIFVCFQAIAVSEQLEYLPANIVDFRILVNNQEVSTSNRVVTIEDTTYISLRDMTEILGGCIEWEDISKTILINSNTSYELFPFKLDDLYGYIDKYGKIIIEPQFEYAGNFSDGVACVGKSKKRNEGISNISNITYGYINTTGKLVIPYINEKNYDFHNNFVGVWELNKDTGYFMNKNGENAFHKSYYDIKDFSNGYAAVLLNNTAENPHKTPIKELQQWTFVDTEGNECGEIYNSVTSFVDGISVVEKDGIKQAINTSFKTVFKSEYILQSYTGNEKYIAKDSVTGKLGVIDDKNNIIIDFKYDYIHYSDNMYKVGVGDNTYGIINKYGKVILEPKLNQFVSGYKAGMCVISDNNTVIDRQGKIIIVADEYDIVDPCSENLLYVYKEENNRCYEGYIDRYGNVLILNEVTI